MAAKLEKVKGHPGVYRRGGRYVAVWRDPSGRQRKTFARTIAEAENVKAARRTDVDRGEFREQSRVTFAEYARTWIETYDGRNDQGIEAHTKAEYRQRLEEAIVFFGRRRLGEITPADVKGYMRHVAARVATRGPNKGEPVSKNTVRLALAPVKAMFAEAREQGVIRDNPAQAVRLPVACSNGSGRRKSISQRELALLLTAIHCGDCQKLDDPVAGCKTCGRWRLFFAFLAHTGLRIGEAIELRWGDVDLGRRQVAVSRRFYVGDVGDPKTPNGVRAITLTQEMGQALWRLRGERSDDDLVFTSETGRRIQPSNLTSRVLKPALRAAGVDERVSFHSFRHTTGSLLYDAGYTDVEVQHWLGHAKASFTKDVYVHPVADEQRTPTFMDALAPVDDLGNARATRAAETGRTDVPVVAAETA